MSSLAGVVESSGPVSSLHSLGSFSPEDFPVPTGREEQWRFTPLRRLRGLHTDVPLDPGRIGIEVSADSDSAIVLTRHGAARIGSALVPSDRVSARAFAASGSAVTTITIPPGVVASRPTVVTIHGDSAEHAAAAHTVVEVGANASAVVV